MSLKTVHVFFVLCTTGLSIFIALWNYNNWIDYGNSLSLFYTAISVLSIFMALYYGKKFLTKFKELSFM